MNTATHNISLTRPLKADRSLDQPHARLAPYRPPRHTTNNLLTTKTEGPRLAKISIACGLLAPSLVVADILYAFIIMNAGNRPVTLIDELTSYVFLLFWIALPVVGIISSARFHFLFAIGKIDGKGLWAASVGGLLSILFAATMAYVYLH